MRTLFQPLLLLALSGCAGTVLRPDVERAATRAALQAALDHEGVAQPPRGDALELDLVEPDAAQQAMMPIREPVKGDDPPAQSGSKTSEGLDPAQQAARTSLQGETSPSVARALEDMTREMTEQRMLMMMQMMSGRGQAPVVVDDTGRMTDLAVAVQRLQDAQEQQADDDAALLAALEALRVSVEERVPQDNAERMQTMEQSIVALPPVLDEIRRAQDVLRERIERLESLHEASPIGPAPLVPAPDEAPPVLIPLEVQDDEPEPVDDEVPTDRVAPDDSSPEVEPVPFQEVEPVDDRSPSERVDRDARREARRVRRAERFGSAQAQREARADARERELAAAYTASADPAPAPVESDERSVMVVPIPASQTLPDDTVPCVPNDDDYVRFPLDERATARLDRLRARGAYSTDPPDPVDLPPAILCTDAP